MELANNLIKIKILLQNVFEGKIVLNENHAEKLINLLGDPDENSPGKLILNTPCFSDFVFQSFENINNVSLSTKVFFLQLMGVLYKNELQFNKMYIQGFNRAFFNFCTIHDFSSNLPPDLHLAFINLAIEQLSHFSGLKELLEHKIWPHVLPPNIHLRTRKTSAAAYRFIAKLVLKVNEYNSEPDLIEILGFLIQPIVTNGYLTLPVIDLDNEAAISGNIITYVSALHAIITEAQNCKPSNKVTTLLKEYFHIDNKLLQIFFVTKNQKLLRLIHACLFQMNFNTLRHLLFEKKTGEFSIKMAILHRNYVTHAITKRDPFILIDNIVQSSIIWSNIQKSHATKHNFPLTFERNGQKFEFSVQIVIFIAVPFIKYGPLRQILGKITITDVMDQFIVKMTKTVTDYIIASCYLFGSMLDEGGTILTRKVTIHALKELLRLRGHLNESQAGPIFQALYYLLGVFILCDKADILIMNENPIDQDDLKLLSHLLDVMKMLLKEHNISWYENVEIVETQASLINLLKQDFLKTKQIVQILDLIDICMKKFLSPNMTLLVENNFRQGSTLNEIGEVIELYTHHADWAVRDSAFNLLNTCTDISFVKYVPLQKVIKDNNLIMIAMRAGFMDPEFYCQCTALRCLVAATKIDSIWQPILIYNMNIYLQLVDMVKNHTEGMVRKEAVNVLAGVYTNQKIEPTLQNTFFEVMTTAALDDLHWEVQLAALAFWKSAIHIHLMYRGMLDGKFPSVTFSREKRKIILMNQEEIRKQLTSVLNDLSTVGCLTVLVGCVNNLQHIDVMAQAYSLAKEIIGIMETYKFEIVNTVKAITEGIPTQCEEDRDVAMNLIYIREEDRNQVIDSILNVDQTELIINLHDNFNQRQRDDNMDIDCPSYMRRELVNPNKFIETFRSTDYATIIENKKSFYVDNLGTLSYLLDDILDLEGKLEG